MSTNAQKGWLMLLSRNEDSSWGGVTEFYEDIGAIRRSGDTIKIASDVWGKLHRKGMSPRPGDGFAFYHTTRAEFDRLDPHKRRPRISLIGELAAIRQDGQYVDRVSVNVSRDTLRRMQQKPIIREAATDSLFQRCGMINGSVATFYEVPPDVWAEFCARAGVSTSTAQQKPDDTDPEISAFEGELRELFVTHRRRERWLRDRKIAEALSISEKGRLICEVPGCGFDFEDVYGEIGLHFAEVHHLKPLAENVRKSPTRLGDLAIVCANCHRMIHRGGQARDIAHLIKRIGF